MKEILRLIEVTHGHAPVLFTSYRVMDAVAQIVREAGLAYPLFILNRGQAAALIGLEPLRRF